MKTWSFVNQNPRTGKTLSAKVLAELLIARGSKVLLIDLDPQSTLTADMGQDPSRTDGGVYALFRNAIDKDPHKAAPQIYSCRHPKLSLLPANTAMAGFDNEHRLGGGLGVVLRKYLTGVSHQYDYVLVDTAPVIGMLMVNALAAADIVVVPAATEAASLGQVESMAQMMAMVNKSRPDPGRLVLMPNRFDRRSRANINVLRALRQQHPATVWRSAIPVDPQLRQFGKPNAPATNSRGIVAYRRLLDDLDSGEYGLKS
jgi:chromosome partitioning protein